MSLPWTEALRLLAAAEALERQRLLDLAVAVRAAAAAPEDWRRWVAEVAGGA